MLAVAERYELLAEQEAAPREAREQMAKLEEAYAREFDWRLPRDVPPANHRPQKDRSGSKSVEPS